MMKGNTIMFRNFNIELEFADQTYYEPRVQLYAVHVDGHIETCHIDKDDFREVQDILTGYGYRLKETNLLTMEMIGAPNSSHKLDANGAVKYLIGIDHYAEQRADMDVDRLLFDY